MSLQTVMHQNQQTIAFLNARNYYCAVASSSSALQCLGSVPSMPQQVDLHSSSSCSFLCESSFDQCMLLTSIPEGDDQCAAHAFIYSRAIPLPYNVTDRAIVAPVLIFNAALAHHLAAIRTSSDSTERSFECLLRAKQLYSLACRSQDIELNPLFHFAVYNNSGLIDLELGKNKNLWKESVGNLVQIYMILVKGGCISRLRHIQGFLESLFAAMPAAAAA
ncbi:unnamed protein product [Cylindrotheca closterium]|uniref:Uncharacterized protein n=1 Tax=Cylindrotheca closterium TaxID=2856 RepID=A0AAD2FYS9_9STRA|nr:unnamed protein product [Cylindrotheca closterium]